MSVLSEENANLLFSLFDDIIKEGNQKISINEHTQLKQFITQQCYYYHNKRFDFSNDINLINKKIIDDSFTYYKKMMENKEALEKRQQEMQKQQEEMRKKMQNTQNTQNTPKMFDRPVNNMFNSNSNITLEYEKQKQDFDAHTKPQTKDIDFSDPNKDIPINNLDVIMTQTLADREKELQSITNQYNNKTQEATKWLNTKINNESTFNPSEEVEILKIDNSTNLKLEPDNVKKEKKRVTFNIIEEAKQQKPFVMSSFLSKLKKKETNTETNPETKSEPELKNKQMNDFSNETLISKLLLKKKPNENNQNSENKDFITIIDKLNVLVLNQEKFITEIENIKSNQDKILSDQKKILENLAHILENQEKIENFKNPDLPPL